MLQEIECLRMRVQQLQTELQQEKNENRELQEARINNTNDASHIMDIGNSEPPSTEELTSISVDGKVNYEPHVWLSDLQLAEKALSRALYRLHRPVPIVRTPGSTTGPLAIGNVEQEAYPWTKLSNGMDPPVSPLNSPSASPKTLGQTQAAVQQGLSPKEAVDNRDWSARPTTPTPDWPPVVIDVGDSLVKKPSYPPPVPRPSKDLLDRVYQTAPRPCFSHYLLSQGCFFKIDCNAPRSIHNHNVKRCLRSHVAEFTPVEIEALRYVAQSLRCKDGINCTRENCYHGHQCQSTGICKGYSLALGGGCPFWPEEHPEGKLAPGAKTVKDNLTLIDDNREKGGKIYTTSLKERWAVGINPMLKATSAKSTRITPDRVASLVHNDLCQILGPGAREYSNEPVDADANGAAWKPSSPVMCLLD
ncbi:hypothetical protein BGX38DRAFT_816573 [Terfezia claveryi]|nr:hypothetical protein BGX38DRAFT_816573 [Terfezia claveryi]